MNEPTDQHDDEAAVRPIQPPVIPDHCPQNPYAVDVAKAIPPPEDRAKGFDGDMLDSILRSRMLEGMRLGFADGNAQASKAYSNIYDEAWRLGVGEGFTQGYGAVMPIALEALEACRARLDLIEKATGSQTIKATCRAGVEEIIQTFGRL